MNILLKAFREILYLGVISSIMIVLILLIKKLFGRTISPKWHYYIWLLLLVRLLLPFTPQSSLSALNLFYIGAQQLNLPADIILAPILDNTENVNQPEAGSPEFPVTAADTGNPGSTAAGTANAGSAGTTNTYNTGNAADSAATDITGPPASSNPGDTASAGGSGQSKPVLIMTVSAILWLSGMLLLAVYTIYINIIFALKVRKNYKPLHDPRVNEILRECRRIVGIRKNIPLYTAKRSRTPSLYSSFRTKILVSEAYLEQLSDQEIKYVFLHELSHYKRKDIAVNWILTILQIVYFFNPLIWLAFYKIHEDCEISCDAEALKYLREEEYQEYGSTVIKLIKLFSESNFIPVTAGLWKHKSNYKRRIIMITKYRKTKWPSTLLTIALILIVGLIGLTGCKKTDTDTSTDNAGGITDADNNTDITGTATPTPEVTEAPVSDGTSDQSKLTELAGLLGLSKNELINKLGDTYNPVDEGGLEFTNPGIRVWFDDKSITNQVYTDKSDIDFNGAKIGDNISSFKNVFGSTLSDSSGNAFFKYDDRILSVFYDTGNETVYAVYLLSEELAPLPQGNNETAPVPAQEDPSSTLLPDVPSPSQSKETFFGDWVIDRVAAYGSAGTYSKETAEELIGKSLSFSADSATCFGDQPSYLEETAKNPAYVTTDISGSDFITNYRMTLNKLGITADSVTQVSASDSEGNGCTFLVKDDNTLIVIGGGTYFELVRKAE